MPVDEFGRTPTSQNVTNVSGVSLGYLNHNFIRRDQSIDMNQKIISNLGSAQGPKDALRRKYVNEKFVRKDTLIDMNQKTIKNVLTPVDESDAANKSYVDSKSVGESDLHMNGHVIKNVKWAEEANDAANRGFVFSAANTKLSLEGGVMSGDINLNGNKIRSSNPNPMHEDELVRKQFFKS